MESYTPVWQLWHSWITVDFHACIWLPGTPQTAATPACFTALYATAAICSAMNQCLVNFYGSAVIFFILLFFCCCFFSSTAYWFHSEVKPEGNQEPFMLPHISASWSNKYQSSMMNCSQHESHCDTMYWFLYDWAHFGVPVWQVVLTDLGANKCDRSVRSCAGQYSSKTHMVFKYEGTGNFMTEPVLHPKFMRLMLGQNRCQSIFFRVTCGFKVLCSLVKVQSIMSHNTA